MSADAKGICGALLVLAAVTYDSPNVGGIVFATVLLVLGAHLVVSAWRGR